MDLPNKRQRVACRIGRSTAELWSKSCIVGVILNYIPFAEAVELSTVCKSFRHGFQSVVRPSHLNLFVQVKPNKSIPRPSCNTLCQLKSLWVSLKPGPTDWIVQIIQSSARLERIELVTNGLETLALSFLETVLWGPCLRTFRLRIGAYMTIRSIMILANRCPALENLSFGLDDKKIYGGELAAAFAQHPKHFKQVHLSSFRLNAEDIMTFAQPTLVDFELFGNTVDAFPGRRFIEQVPGLKHLSLPEITCCWAEILSKLPDSNCAQTIETIQTSMLGDSVGKDISIQTWTKLLNGCHRLTRFPPLCFPMSRLKDLPIDVWDCLTQPQRFVGLSSFTWIWSEQSGPTKQQRSCIHQNLLKAGFRVKGFPFSVFQNLVCEEFQQFDCQLV